MSWKANTHICWQKYAQSGAFQSLASKRTRRKRWLVMTSSDRENVAATDFISQYLEHSRQIGLESSDQPIGYSPARDFSETFLANKSVQVRHDIFANTNPIGIRQSHSWSAPQWLHQRRQERTIPRNASLRLWVRGRSRTSGRSTSTSRRIYTIHVCWHIYVHSCNACSTLVQVGLHPKRTWEYGILRGWK